MFPDILIRVCAGAFLAILYFSVEKEERKFVLAGIALFAVAILIGTYIH